MIKDLYDYLAKPDKTIGEHVEDLIFRANILRKLGYIKDIHIYNLLIQACKGHDLGKANKEFLKRILNPKLHFDETKEILHNILSVYYLDKNEFDENTDDYLIVACCILFHHDYCNEPLVIKTRTSQINSLLIPEYNQKPSRRMLKNICNNYLKKQETIIVKGLLHRCDYSASGNYEIEYPNDFLEAGLAQMMNEWQKKKKDSCWNELQEFCIENREENIIALAPTGMGKTEAGLLWIGDNKGFFILPIRTAINAIYDRIKNQILKDEKLEERLGLLHSESLSYYESHVGQEMDILDYRNRGQVLSLPLNISTLDQLFDFVFKYKGYEMKLATLSYSKIVIDEIQMYDAEMLAYLIYGLRRIHELGGKIAIVTATLPPFIKKLLKDKSIGNIEFKEQDFTNDLKRHSVKVMDESICEDDIIQCYNQNIKEAKGNKILVVCNTIKKAQKMYDQIKEKDGTLNSHVFHSRFDREDRKKLENEIKEFGKTYNERNEIDIQNDIWIATSIVEVSLDIDFDYLFTELTDLNGLFQRMGRCNRKGVKQLEGYNCFVYCDGSDVKQGQKGFLDPVFYEQSKKALKTVDGILEENEKKKLINDYFTFEAIRSSDYMHQFKDTFDWISGLDIGEFKRDEIKMRNIFTKSIVPKIVYDQNKNEIILLEEKQTLISKKLKDSEIKQKEKENLFRERIEIQERLRDFIVQIPYYEYHKYYKKVYQTYETVNISKYEHIEVMDCQYDIKGFYPLNYEKVGEDAMIF